MEMLLVSLIAFLTPYFESRRRCYPTMANSVSVAGTTTAWSPGTYTEIVPSSTINSNYRILEIDVLSVSATDELELVVATGAASSETIIGSIRFTAVGKYSFGYSLIPANTRISARLANKGTTAITAKISIAYALES